MDSYYRSTSRSAGEYRRGHEPTGRRGRQPARPHHRATYELHDRAGEFTSVLFAQKHFPTASELLLGGSIFPAMQNFLLAARTGAGRAHRGWARV